jgi:hypothetical protein
MSDNRNDKYEEHDDSEYHFTDEEVNYEVETETSKMAPAAGGEQKAGLGARLSQSKRMLASLAVFFVLVIIVYKVVSPGSTAPSTEIASASSTAPQELSPSLNQGSAAPTEQASQMAALPSPPTPPIPSAPAASSLATMPNVSAQMPSPAVPQAAALANQMPANAPQAPQMTAQPSAAASNPNLASVPTAPTASTMPAAPTQAVPSMQTTAQPVDAGQMAGMPSSGQAPQIIIQQTPQQANNLPPQQNPQQNLQQNFQQSLQQNPAQMATGLPSVIPVQPALPAYNNAQPPSPPPSAAAQQTADANEKMEQLHTQYTQQYNDFSNQNKTLQNQVQTLNSRVSVMESQLSQLVQALTQRVQENSTAGAPDTNQVMPAQPRVFEGKVSYNVQAIIPGRAWLKAENGETLTVAEGDVIKGVGRVTKIDPYDGLVEINTGSKAISLSYGNGG